MGNNVCNYKKRRRKIQYIKRSEKTIIEIKLAFLGTSKNFYLLEENLVKNKNIDIYQYSNYLCQIAFCIELGLKSLIIDKYNVEKEHDLYKLFCNTPTEFQNKFKELYNNKSLIDSFFYHTKYLFIYLRYMELSKLRFFLDKCFINSDKSINIENSLKQENVKFLQDLLDEIKKFHIEKRQILVNEILKNGSDINSIKDVIDTLERI
jgi:hypothetical protein